MQEKRLEKNLKTEKKSIFRCNVRARDCKFDLPDSGGLLSLPRKIEVPLVLGPVV
jgi:hypothetical protein